jgi:hypothetical protein
MASGAWAATALLASTLANTNPFRPEGFQAEPWHFDPFQLLPQGRPPKAEPQLRVRVGQLKHLFDTSARGQ